MTKKTEWEIERDKADAIRAKAMMSLTVDQAKAIKETYSGSRATALKKSELGKEIFKNIAIYEKTYNKLRKLKNSQGLISAMLEDVGLKKGSNYISYYIWLTMAVGATALALTKYNS